MDIYLKGHMQSLTVTGQVSEPKPLTTGSPQGSVLEPYMYLLYTSPLFNIAKKPCVMIHMCADDTQLFLLFDLCDIEEALEKIEAAVEEIRKWMSDNHLNEE